MKYLKTFEEITPVEYVAPQVDHPSYKAEEKKKKRKKSGIGMEPLMVLPNKTKDAISFKAKP
jgi:hypothetical protein